MELSSDNHPLGCKPITPLIVEFAIPAIISGLVGALYNIVDQIFIGQGVGILGNAATNVAFPVTNLALSLCLLIGAGTAANFSLNLGRGDRKEATKYVQNGITYSLLAGIVVMILVLLFLEPMLKIFGATDKILSLALTYTGITAFGLPFLMFTISISALIRADGSPKYAMMCNIVGAVINTILDPIFIFGLDLGMAGAAYATVTGQVISAGITAFYLFHMNNITLKGKKPEISLNYGKNIAALGLSPFINQIALMFFQIVLNNTLTYYGARSIYGSEIPLAVVGVISKVNVIYFSFTFGVCQGCQPIFGFNYGAKKYHRVKEAFFKGLKAVMIISFIAFAAFQLFPRQILSIFGKGDELYYRFGEKYFRIFLAMTLFNGIQPICSFFFTSIGRAVKGMIVSMTRQILFLIPLIYLFARLFGIEGVLFAGPIADGAACLLAAYLASKEMKKMNEAMAEEETSPTH